ncbi:MAG: ethylbenzene dehydrogenase-related protein, partial [Thermodesulfobacteriota bacterium]|nr:ethylbenzene dehydrogenase-related protein [Thermodesulfobacteriota bacterium]
LTEEEITEGEVINTDPANSEYAGQSSVESAWLNYEAVEAFIPGKIISTPFASRGDILHAATWKNGTWTHLFKRKLSTGNDDDVAFSTEKEYEFSVTVFDNCGWGEIPPAHNTYGSGQYQILRFK